MKNRTNINFGQGNTPLIRLYNLEQKLQWQGKLWAKCEYQNPTGSFKDRGSVAEISEAIKQKKQGVVCASTGNMAASLSAFAAKAQLSCIVVVPQKTPLAKLQQTLITNAQIIKVMGNYDACVKKAKAIALEKNYLLCGDYPIRRIGQQSIGTELANSGINFDAFICPVGNGTVGCAIAEGFATYKKFPQFIGVQGKGADPLTQAFEKKEKTFTPLLQPQTIASAMNVGNPLDGQLTLEWISKTKGIMLSVWDEEIVSAQKLLATSEGLYVEPAAAAAIAALMKLSNRTMNLVVILTGHGLKGGVPMAQENESKKADPRALSFGEFGDTASTVAAGRKPETPRRRQKGKKEKPAKN